jgi:UvrD-like helicase C-terminal domain
LSVIKRFDPDKVKKPDPTFASRKQNGTPIQVHDVATDDGEASIMWTIAQRSLPKKSVLFLIPAKQYADKGLETDVVCAAGLNEGILPRDGVGSQELVETARLVYVSMTRAIQELHLFHARKRDASVTYLAESFARASWWTSRIWLSIMDCHSHIRVHHLPIGLFGS